MGEDRSEHPRHVGWLRGALAIRSRIDCKFLRMSVQEWKRASLCQQEGTAAVKQGKSVFSVLVVVETQLRNKGSELFTDTWKA